MIPMNKIQFFGITIILVTVGLVVALLWGLNEAYGWLENETQELVIAMITAIIAGLLIESVYKKFSPKSKMLKTTQTRMTDNKESLARLLLPNNNNIIVNGTSKVLGREDFLGVVTSDKLYFIGKDHFKILRKADSFYIEDLNTKNGTTVNGIKLEGQRMHRLDDGDEIIVAKSLSITYNEL